MDTAEERDGWMSWEIRTGMCKLPGIKQTAGRKLQYSEEHGAQSGAVMT